MDTKVSTEKIMAIKAQIRSHIEASRLIQARELCNELYNSFRGDAETCYLFGMVLGELGFYAEATEKLQEAITLRPDAFLAHYGLGIACNKTGKHLAAEQALRSALALRKNHPDVILELVNTLLILGKNQPEIEKLLYEVLQLQPDNPDALHGLGQLRQSSRRHREAADFYQRALKADPQRPGTLSKLGQSHYKLGNLEQAIIYYNKALEINPDLDKTQNMLAIALLNSGKREAARAHFKRALGMYPENLDIIAGFAYLNEQEGRYKEAYELLEPCMKKGARHAGIAAAFTNICQQFDCCDEAIAYALDVLKHRELGHNALGQLHSSLGRLYDRLDRYDEAFEHINASNMLEPDTFNPAEFIAANDTVTRFLDWQFFATAPRSSVQTNRPVFIIGMPRSGTSLTEQILASHPDVFGGGELVLIGEMVKTLPGYPGAGPSYPYNIGNLTTAVLDDLAVKYLDAINRLDPDAARITDKMPQNFLYLGLIALVFPKARIIHCVRDPRDTCLSIFFQNFNKSHSYATRLENLGLYYKQYEKLTRHFLSIIDNPVLEVCYEDMVTDQESNSRRLLDFLELPWDEQCLEFNRSDRYVNTSSYAQVREPVYTRSIDRWKMYEKHLGPLFSALG